MPKSGKLSKKSKNEIEKAKWMEIIGHMKIRIFTRRENHKSITDRNGEQVAKKIT